MEAESIAFVPNLDTWLNFQKITFNRILADMKFGSQGVQKMLHIRRFYRWKRKYPMYGACILRELGQRLQLCGSLPSQGREFSDPAWE